MDFQYTATGGIALNGEASVVSTFFSWEGSGELSIGSSSNAFISLSYEGSGSLTIGSSIFNPIVVDPSFYFDQQLTWDVEAEIDINFGLTWNVGSEDLYFYRIQCMCLDSTSDPCLTTNFNSNDAACGNNPPAGFTTIKYIAATDVRDLCEKLQRGFITQPFKCKIDKVQKFTRPVSKRRTAELQAQGHDLRCNELIDVSIEGIQECLEFNLIADTVQSIGFSMTVSESIYTTEGSGGIQIGGEAIASIMTPSATGEGGFVIGGEATVQSSSWQYIPDNEASLIIGGDGEIWSSIWWYTGSGGFAISGEISNTSPYYSFEGNGGLSLSGEAGFKTSYSYTPLFPLLVTFDGEAASYPSNYTGNGGVSFGGEADIVVSSWIYVGNGSVSFGGESDVVSPHYSWEGEGGISLSGIAGISWNVEASGGFSLSGESDVSLLLKATGDGGFTIGDSASVISPVYSYEGSGELSIGGESEVNHIGVFEVSIGMTMTIKEIDVAFGIEGGESLSLGSSTVTSPCGCGQLPQTLQFEHNFINSAHFSSFLNRNGLKIPSKTTLTYRRNITGWSRNFHLRGNSPFSIGIEVWDILFDFSCADNIGGQDLQTSVWKFCAFFRRRNLTTGEDDDSRLLFTFPISDVCPTGEVETLNFSFSYDTQQGTLLANTGTTVGVIVVHDNIRLFSSRNWQLFPDLKIRITAAGFEDAVNRTDITSLFPFDPTAPLITTRSN